MEIVRGKKLLKHLSTWGIGGPCNYFILVHNHTHLLSAIRYCRENSIRLIIIGKGSNCLFEDLGFDSCVVLDRIEFLGRIEPGTYRVGSGFGFNRLGVQCSNEGFAEFTAGIPGTDGGAAYMNAGANGQETANVVEYVDIVNNGRNFQRLSRNEIRFGYRFSEFQHMKDLAAIVAVTFRLQSSSAAARRQQEYMERRRISQPLKEKSAGSVFQNTPNLGISAAQLIEEAGIKGFKVGGGMVSNIHANFFINTGHTTSQDMLALQ